MTVWDTIDGLVYDRVIFNSIELEKQKAEHDRMVKIAEEKKQVIIEIMLEIIFDLIIGFQQMCRFCFLSLYRMFAVELQN